MWIRAGVVSMVVAGAACGSSTGDSVGYVATDLGPVDAVSQGYSDLASAYMNESGEIAAVVHGQPSIYKTNQWQAVGPVGLVPMGSRIVGFSAQREIVVTNSLRTYFIDAAETATEIVPPADPNNAPNAVAGAMSPDGTVAGWFFKGNPRLPELFTWKAGVFTDRGPGIEVFGVNDAGVIVAAVNNIGSVTGSVVVLPDGTQITLTSSLSPSACNAAGVAGGEEGIHPVYPVLFDHGTVIELTGPHPNGAVTADMGWVTALNDAGDAVGVIDANDQHPFVMLHGGAIASLAALFPTPGAAMPIAIDNRGDILVSTPAPSNAGLELVLLKVKADAPVTQDTATITLTGAPAGIDASPFGAVNTMASLSASRKRLDIGVTAASTIPMGARTIQVSVVLPIGGTATITEGSTYSLSGLAGTNIDGGSLSYYQRIVNDKGSNDVVDTFGAAGGTLTIDQLGAVTHLTLTGVLLSGASGMMQLDGTINTVNLVAP